MLAGLTTGCIYGTVALALVMIYQGTHYVNFAQGEMAMFSTYMAWALIQRGAPYWVAFALTVVLSFGIGAAIERFVIRPLAASPILTVVTVFIGLLAIFNSVAGWLFTYEIRTFPSPFRLPAGFTNPYLSAHEVGAAAVTLAMVALLWAFFRHTRLGLMMRAVAANPQSSRLVGIRVGRMLSLGWGLAAAVGAIAGMMVAPILYLDPNMMGGVLVYAFAAALLGGIESPVGAVVGGLIVGVVENLAGAYIVGTELKLTVALVVIVTVLVVRPSGLFGRVRVTRV